jgi:hypothetical protein
VKGLYVPLDGDPKVYASDNWNGHDIEFLIKQPPVYAAKLPYLFYRHELVAYYGVERVDLKVPRPCVILALRDGMVTNMPLESILRITTALVLEDMPQLEGRLAARIGQINPKGTSE